MKMNRIVLLAAAVTSALLASCAPTQARNQQDSAVDTPMLSRANPELNVTVRQSYLATCEAVTKELRLSAAEVFPVPLGEAGNIWPQLIYSKTDSRGFHTVFYSKNNLNAYEGLTTTADCTSTGKVATLVMHTRANIWRPHLDQMHREVLAGIKLPPAR